MVSRSSGSCRLRAERLTATLIWSPCRSGSTLVYSSVQNPVSQGPNEPCVLGERYEFIRWDVTSFWVPPSDKSFDVSIRAGLEVCFRLVMKDELLVLNRLSEIADQSEPGGTVDPAQTGRPQSRFRCAWKRTWPHPPSG